MRSLKWCVVSLLVLGCGPEVLIVGNAEPATVRRAVSGATSVRLSLPGTLVVTTGEAGPLTLTGDSNLLSLVQTDVVGTELVVQSVPGASLRPLLPLRLEWTVPTLRGLATSSSGSITAASVSGTDVWLKVQSSGSLDVGRVQASTLVTQIASSGDVQVREGEVKDHHVSIVSSGSVRATGLSSTTADATLTSSGSAWLWVTDRLDVTLTSSGSLHYLGAPRVVAHVSSSGAVRPIEQ